MKQKLIVGACLLALAVGAVAVPVFATSEDNTPANCCDATGTQQCCEQQRACCK